MVGKTHLVEQHPSAVDLSGVRGAWAATHDLLTFRRTYSTWAHEKGVPGKVVAELMGHAKVETTLNVYTQVIDASKRAAAQKVGGELFTIVHSAGGTRTLTH